MTVLSAEDFQKKYEIDTHYIEDLPKWLQTQQPQSIYINAGDNPDSGLSNFVPD